MKGINEQAHSPLPESRAVPALQPPPRAAASFRAAVPSISVPRVLKPTVTGVRLDLTLIPGCGGRAAAGARQDPGGARGEEGASLNLTPHAPGVRGEAFQWGAPGVVLEGGSPGQSSTPSPKHVLPLKRSQNS